MAPTADFVEVQAFCAQIHCLPEVLARLSEVLERPSREMLSDQGKDVLRKCVEGRDWGLLLLLQLLHGPGLCLAPLRHANLWQ
jgi:hypothetical protein